MPGARHLSHPVGPLCSRPQRLIQAVLVLLPGPILSPLQHCEQSHSLPNVRRCFSRSLSFTKAVAFTLVPLQ